MGRRGHTLVELLVALVLLLLVAAGLLAFLAGCYRALGRAMEGVALRQGLRRALELLADDVQEAGFLVPCRAPPSGPPLRVGAEGDLILIKDEVLPAEGRLAEALLPETPAPLSRRLRVAADPPVRLRAGDVLLLGDEPWEGLLLEGPADFPGEGIATGLTGPPGAHGAGAPVAFLRPLRRVTWRLEGEGVLVRREGAGGAPPEEDEEVRPLADHLTRFQVSLAGGQGGAPRVTVALEARGPSGTRCALSLVRTPRGGGAW